MLKKLVKAFRYPHIQWLPGSIAIFLDFFITETGQKKVRIVSKSDPESEEVLMGGDALTLEEF